MLNAIKKSLAAALLVTSISGIATVAEAKTEYVFLKQAPSLELAIDYGRHFEVAKVIDTNTGKTVAAVKIAETAKPKPVFVQTTPASAFHILPFHGTVTNVSRPLDFGKLNIKIGERPEESRARWMREHQSQRDLECSTRGDRTTCFVKWEAKHHDDFRNCK